MQITMESDGPVATETMAERIGRRLRGGEVVELASDLGGGKTTFTRGLARGAGSKDQVASPTFTLERQYTAGQLMLHHFDFYRLDDPGVLEQQLAEAVHDPAVVTIVEWSDVVQSVLPTRRLRVEIAAQPGNDETRRLTFEYPPELTYLMEDT